MQCCALMYTESCGGAVAWRPAVTQCGVLCIICCKHCCGCAVLCSPCPHSPSSSPNRGQSGLLHNCRAEPRAGCMWCSGLAWGAKKVCLLQGQKAACSCHVNWLPQVTASICCSAAAPVLPAAGRGLSKPEKLALAAAPACFRQISWLSSAP